MVNGRDALDKGSLLLMIAAGINFGLVGLLNVDVVWRLFGNTIIGKFIYLLFGAAGVYGAGKLMGFWGGK